MGRNTKIEWTAYRQPDGTLVQGHTFNPWWGCHKVSEACTNCYAEALADRWRPGAGLWRGNRVRTSASYWKGPLQWNRDAERDGTRPRVFCASMADVFEGPFDEYGIRRLSDEMAANLDAWRRELWTLIEATPNLVWLLLTKRPRNIRKMVPLPWLAPAGSLGPHPAGWPSNVWVGATTETRRALMWRVPDLLDLPAPVKFISAEPLLEKLDVRPYLGRKPRPDPDLQMREVDGLSWVIVGSESGPRRRPTELAWVRALRGQCAAAGVPFFAKQLDLGDGLVHAPELDGRQWLEAPHVG